jgi:hypothetical protein
MNQTPSPDHAQWISILEEVAKRPPAEINDKWVWLLSQLGLSHEYFLAVREAVRQGRWRTAKNPRAYLKTVAKREALKLGLLEWDPNDRLEMLPITSDSTEPSQRTIERLAYERGTSEAIKGANGVWKRGRGREYDPRDEFSSYRNFLLSYVPKELIKISRPSRSLKALMDKINSSTDAFHLHPQPSIEPRWEDWAKLAGFDVCDRLVLKYRLEATSRDRAIAEQPDQNSKKALQAAWRKFDRTGIQRLKRALEKYSCSDVPE